MRVSPASLATIAVLLAATAGPAGAAWHSGPLSFSTLTTIGATWSSPDSSREWARGEAFGRTAQPQGNLRLASSANLAPRVAFQFQGEVLGREGRTMSEQAYFRFHDLVAHGGLNAAVGIFDATLPILAEPNRPTRARYLAPVKLDGRGLALDGRRAAWGFGAGVIDSPRHLPALRERALHRLEDTYFRVSRDFGSQSVSAQWRFDRQDSNLQTLSWLQHLQGDVAARFGNDRLTVIPSYTFSRLDDRPGPGIHERHQFGMIETLFALDRGGRWLVSARAEHEYRTRDALISERDANAEVFNLSCRVEARARLSIEGSRLADNTGSPGSRRLDAFVQIGL